MPEDAAHDPYHPSNWANGGRNADQEGQQLHDLTAAHRAFLAWFADLLARGGWASLGQAAKEVVTLDAKGRQITEPQLGVVQSTLSRWLAGQTLPVDKSLRTVIDRLTERIDHRREDVNTPVGRQPAAITPTEVTKGMRLLKAARTPPGDPAPPPLQTYMPNGPTEADPAWEQQWDRYDRLHAQWEMAQKAAEAVWESYWDRLDRLYAECETAQEAAKDERDERLKVEYKNSVLRAGIRIAERKRDRALEKARHAEEKMKAQETERAKWDLFEMEDPSVTRPQSQSALQELTDIIEKFGFDERAGQVSVIDEVIPSTPYDAVSNTQTEPSAEAASSALSASTRPFESEGESESPCNDSPGSDPLTLCVATIRKTSSVIAGLALIVSIPAMSPIILMSGAWAFWHGIPWGHVRDQDGKSLGILTFVIICLFVSFALIAAPPLLAEEKDSGRAFGCLISLIGVTCSCVLLGNYPNIMEWLPKIVGAY